MALRLEPVDELAESMPEHAVDESVRRTVLYADIFDHPLTRDEIVRYFPARAASRSQIEQSICRLISRSTLQTDGTFVYAQGRDEIVTVRLARQTNAVGAWRQARFYARILSALPYVRMVAVTGSLAMDNVELGDDIDYLIVTAPGRLWMARGMVVAVTKLARLFGVTLCPNYLISSRALQMDQHNHYVAHELVQMVPLYGSETAEHLFEENKWYRELLPNAQCAGLEHMPDRIPAGLDSMKTLGEKLLWSSWGDKIEQWEQERKIAKLSRQIPPQVREAVYTADVCKGHDHGHAHRIMYRWVSRMSES